MKLFAPEYYKDFVCIADRCRHSCCVGWEIDIDEDTADMYKTLTDGYGKKIKESVAMTDVPHFKLEINDRCPHLDASGLCSIITELGDEYLCEICREHPRFYNDTNHGKEVGIGMSCEEACRIILNSDGFGNIVEIGDIYGEIEDSEFDPLPYRSRIFSVIADETLTHDEKLDELYVTFGFSRSIFSDDIWRELLSSLEYLEDVHREMFLKYSSDVNIKKEFEKPLGRALAYFVYRHCSNTFDEGEFFASLGFCFFCERLLASIVETENAKTVEEFAEIARILSEEIEYSEDNTEIIKSEFV
ncbi:MAG: flagellin lysine-N-methylase [Clostridia bacterium]|nr:flagellin lysine-N-methylase [Clostridia bacterium]